MAELLLKDDKLSDSNNNDDTESNSNSTADGQICRDYQRGVCNRGGKCKFSHPEGLGKEVESSPMICRDFQNGKCSRSTCKYMHISVMEEKMYLRTGQMPRRPQMPGGPPGRGGFGSGGGGGGGGGGGYPTRASRSDPVCKDFLNNKCTRGSSCKYRHVYEDDYAGFGGFDDFPRKRRRDSFGDSDFSLMKEENEGLRRQVADLQKQVSDLKATNEVLLEQNARYRNAAASATSYPAPSSYSGSYASKPTATNPPASTSFAASYPSAYNGGSSATASNNSPYTTSTPYGATSADTSSYSSSYPSGTGYMKFD